MSENRLYKVSLIQRHWSHTETFDIEAKNKKEAEEKAARFIDKEKSLKDGEWELRIEADNDRATNTVPEHLSDPDRADVSRRTDTNRTMSGDKEFVDQRQPNGDPATIEQQLENR